MSELLLISRTTRGEGGGQRDLLESIVHVVDIDARQATSQLGWSEELKHTEQLVLGFIPPIVASGVNKKTKGFVPEPACYLIHKLAWRMNLRGLQYLEVAIYQGVVVDTLRLNMP